MSVDRYELTVTVERARRVVDRARKREPEELFGFLIDNLVADDWIIVDGPRVHRMTNP